MGTQADLPSLERRLAGVADRQYGVLTREQLTASGLSAHGIHERVRTRRLLRLHRGVYAIGHRRLRREGHWLAAVLACGKAAVLSHASAAALWNLRGSAATRTDVTVPSQNGSGTPGRHPHPSLRPPGRPRRHHEGRHPGHDRRTNPARSRRRPTQTSPEASDRRVGLPEALRPDLPGCRRERQPGETRRHVAQSSSGATALHALGARDSLLNTLRPPQHPRPLTNQIVCGYEVDAFWPHPNLVVELDGYAAHGTRRAFQRDRARDRRLVGDGYMPIRVTPLDLADARSLAAELLDLLRS
jgi:very-short-patch-repair endonuclease